MHTHAHTHTGSPVQMFSWCYSPTANLGAVRSQWGQCYHTWSHVSLSCRNNLRWASLHLAECSSVSFTINMCLNLCRRSLVWPLPAAGATICWGRREAEGRRVGNPSGQGGRHRGEGAGGWVWNWRFPHPQAVCGRRSQEHSWIQRWALKHTHTHSCLPVLWRHPVNTHDPRSL